MMANLTAAHAPALSVAEAAMLPALPRKPVDGGRPVDNFLPRRGSMAGRAVLSYVKNASAQRRRR